MLQCDPQGKCRCRPGVVGDKCDRCANNHYELSVTGCKVCNCDLVGSFDSPPICDPRDGSCRCKANVEGKNCDKPKPGFFDLAPYNLHGALPCFCYGHSSQCESSLENLAVTRSVVDYSQWTAIDQQNRNIDVIRSPRSDAIPALSVITPSTFDDIWFVAPTEDPSNDSILITGNQLYSYGRELSFTITISTDDSVQLHQRSSRITRKDVIIENENLGLQVHIPITGSSTSSNAQFPSNEPQRFTFTLNENSGWMPTLSPHDFQRLLTNISSIKIRASYSYSPNARTLLSQVRMGSAKLASKTSNQDRFMIDQQTNSLNTLPLVVATFIENCTCPEGYIGQHCEQCAPKYRRDPVNGGVFSRCVPCTCNGHSVSCDSSSGKCDCMHHTSGDNCEKCKEGYYGSAVFTQR
jgi:laminin, gamma 1